MRTSMKPEHRGVLLRLLINRAHGTFSESSLKGLPPEETAQASQHSISSADIQPLLTHAQSVLPTIHYSWLYEQAKNQEPSFYTGIASCLSEEQKKGLCKMLKIEPPTRSLTPFLQKFYLQHLYKTFPLLSDSLPVEYLPDSPLNALTRLKKKQLVELIDSLSMFDLAHEMRTIVGTKHLKNLYTCLSANQQQFLRQCLHLKDRLTPPKLGLQTWNGEANELLGKLHRRGLTRLALALSGQHEDLIWAIVHKLDTGRGTLMKKLIKPEAVPGISEALILQLQMAIKGIT